MQPNLAVRENVKETETPANTKWIARFYYFRHLYSAGSGVCIAHTTEGVAHRYGQLYLHCSLIYCPFQLFLHSDCAFSEGEINPVQRARQSGGGCIIHAGGGRLHALPDRLL